MIKRTCAGFLALLLVVSLVFLAGPVGKTTADDDAEIKMAQEAVVKLAKMKDAEQAKAAEDLAKKVFIEYGMLVFKPRTRKGLGVGDKPGAITPDSIELKIMAMARKSMSPAQVKSEADALKQMSDVTKAMAELTYHWGPKRAAGEKTPAEWKKLTDEMKKSAVDLKAAVDKADPAAVKSAATNLNSSCVNCHSIFRDS